MLELLVEKVLNSAGCLLSPGDALRRVFESLAGVILLPDSPGFLDPCEKEPTDAGGELSSQEREDITSSAQFALRYNVVDTSISFNIYSRLYQKSFNPAFKSSFGLQNYLLNLLDCVVNSQRLFCFHCWY